MVESIIAKVFEIDEASVTAEMSPETTPAWDSLNHLKLVTALEAELGIKLSMSDVMSLTDVAKVLEVVARHLSARPTGT